MGRPENGPRILMAGKNLHKKKTGKKAQMYKRRTAFNFVLVSMLGCEEGVREEVL